MTNIGGIVILCLVKIREDFIVKSVTSKGKKNTRDTILHKLKISPQTKIEDLAEAANISPVTVRHHMNSLQADGLVELESVRRKVGRPYYVYSLSEQGHELFPQPAPNNYAGQYNTDYRDKKDEFVF